MQIFFMALLIQGLLMNNLDSQTTDQQAQQNKNIKEAEKAQTFFDIVYSQFKDHKAAVIGGYIIIFFMLIALLQD